MLTKSRIFADPRWLPFRAPGQTYDHASPELLAQSLEIAIHELGTQARVSKWLLHNVTTAHGLLRGGEAGRALALLDAAIQPTEAVAS